PGLIDLTHDDAGSEVDAAGIQRHPPEQSAEEGRLAGPVGPRDRDLLRPPDLHRDRTEDEVPTAYDRLGQRSGDRAGARSDRDLHPQLPLLARFLDGVAFETLDGSLALAHLGGLLLG